MTCPGRPGSSTGCYATGWSSVTPAESSGSPDPLRTGDPASLDRRPPPVRRSRGVVVRLLLEVVHQVAEGDVDVDQVKPPGRPEGLLDQRSGVLGSGDAVHLQPRRSSLALALGLVEPREGDPRGAQLDPAGPGASGGDGGAGERRGGEVGRQRAGGRERGRAGRGRGRPRGGRGRGARLGSAFALRRCGGRRRSGPWSWWSWPGRTGSWTGRWRGAARGSSRCRPRD